MGIKPLQKLKREIRHWRHEAKVRLILIKMERHMTNELDNLHNNAISAELKHIMRNLQ